MQTPTHLLVAAAALVRGPRKTRPALVPVLAGGLLPDAAIFVMFFWERLINGVTEAELWSTVYWSDGWQTAVIIGNSIPLFAALFVIGLVTRTTWLWALAAAALLHLALDLPVHADDAHVHFWPFTDWRFHSPLSYWDPAHHGGMVMIVEALLALVMMGILWRRFPNRWVGAVMGLAVLTYVGVPLYFSLALG